MSEKHNHPRGYVARSLIGIDQLANAVLGPVLNKVFGVDGFGYPDETITSVLGKYQTRCTLCKWTCAFLDKLDPGHCLDGIERDEGKGPE